MNIVDELLEIDDELDNEYYIANEARHVHGYMKVEPRFKDRGAIDRSSFIYQVSYAL